jgi:glycosyltransferase involved in cell wall biosynthesis
VNRPSVLEVCVVGGSGGVEHHVLALSRRLASSTDVCVAAAEKGWLARAAGSAGLTVEPLPEPRGNFDVRTLVALRRMIRERKPQIVHSHLGRSDWYAWLAVLGSGEVTLVSTEHGISADRPDLFVKGVRRALHELAHGLRLRRTSAIVAVSASTASALKERYPVLRSKLLAVIAPGIERDELFNLSRGPRDPSAPLKVVTISRLSAEKGPDLALRAFAALAARCPARLNVVGAGPEESRLAALAVELGVVESVRFSGSLEDVTGALEEADAFLLMSRSENLPIAMLEAMASGIPPVVTDVGGVAEVVLDRHNGIVVPPEDVTTAADALLFLAGDESARLRMGASARATARSYAMPLIVPAIERLYESVA